MTQAILQTVTAAIGTAGFAVLFNVRGKKLVLLTLGGAIGWVVYLLCAYCGLNPFFCALFATMATAVLGELFARILRAPVLVLLVPMLIPLVPGKDLYYFMSALIQGNADEFTRCAQLTLTAAGAIALGVIAVATIVHILMGVHTHTPAACPCVKTNNQFTERSNL